MTLEDTTPIESGSDVQESSGSESTEREQGAQDTPQEQALPSHEEIKQRLSLNDPQYRDSLRQQQYAPPVQPQQPQYAPQNAPQAPPQQMNEEEVVQRVVQELGGEFDPYNPSHQYKLNQALIQNQLQTQLQPLTQFVNQYQQQNQTHAQEQQMNAMRETVYGTLSGLMPKEHADDIRLGKTYDDVKLRDALGEIMQEIATQNYPPHYHESPDVLKACLQHAFKSQKFQNYYSKLKGIKPGLPHTERSGGAQGGTSSKQAYLKAAKSGDARAMLEALERAK